jgi:signal transduction histidine kinase
MRLRTTPAAELGAGDVQLVRTAARRLGLQAASMVALTVLVLAGLAGALVVRQQHRASDRTLSAAAANADDVGDPPAGTWLVLLSPAGRELRSPGLPRGLPDQRAITLVTARGGTVVADDHVGGQEYRLRTTRRANGTVVQAVQDLRGPHAEQARLVLALLTVGASGLVLAGLIGALLGRRAVRPLAEALTRQRAFVADASHELRTPLTLLSTRVQVLQRNTPAGAAGAALRDQVDAIYLDTSRMVQLVEDLLLAADPQDARTDELVDLALLAHEVEAAAHDYAAQRDVDLTYERAPQSAEPLLVAATHVAVRRAVLAVLDNAIEHTPAGGRVRIRAIALGTQIAVDITDTGPGLHTSDYERIFDRFHSGRQKAGRRSYGLGLSLARDVAERFGGTLTVQSTGSNGTTFRLKLPRTASTDPSAPFGPSQY